MIMKEQKTVFANTTKLDLRQTLSYQFRYRRLGKLKKYCHNLRVAF